MFLLRRGERVDREHQTPIGVLHQLVVRWGDAETATARRALQRWFDGVAFVDVQAQTFAEFWRANNQTAVSADGPLWVVLGDSTAQGVGASSPLHGYVGQVRSALTARSRRPWRVLNLSRSGAQTWQVLDQQLPLLEELGQEPDLVTCGIGSNDIFATPPTRLRSTLHQLIDRLPRSSVMFDLPLPDRLWRVGGLCSPYVAGVNRTIHTAAARRGLPVAELSPLHPTLARPVRRRPLPPQQPRLPPPCPRRPGRSTTTTAPACLKAFTLPLGQGVHWGACRRPRVS